MKVDEYKQQAQANIGKSVSEFKVGDFIYTAVASGKDVNFMDFVDARENWKLGLGSKLCKIVDIVNVPEEEDFLENWLDKPAPAHRGGSQSDDVDVDNHSQLTSKDYATFFDLVTIYRKPSGKWIAVDCQGYDYWRYVHLPINYAIVFADERTAALEKIAAIEKQRKDARSEELAEHVKAFEAKQEELKAKYPSLILHPKNGRQVSNNIRKFLAIEFPGCKFKVSVKQAYERNSYHVNIIVDEADESIDRHAVKDRSRIWFDTIPTGRVDTNDYGYEQETKSCPMWMFGYISYGCLDIYKGKV